MKLASELHKRSTGRSIYILDEPTTGLHVDDISRLLKVLNRLVENGDTVVIIEHNLDVIKTADYIIDLGPKVAKVAVLSLQLERRKTLQVWELLILVSI